MTTIYLVYFLLMAVPMAMECLPRLNTESSVRKVGLLFISLGGLLHLAGISNYSVELGALLLLIDELFKTYLIKHTRRCTDGKN